MALIGSIAIAMKVSTQQLGKGLRKASGMVAGFGAQVAQAGSGLGALATGAAALGGGAGLKKMIGDASDLNETMSKTAAVFGPAAASVTAEADRMASAFGTSRQEFLSSASALGGIFKGAGFAQGEAAKMSTDFVKLAGDVSSFANLPFDQAFDKLRAGLTGESEPLKSLGVLMNEDAVKAEALRMGLGKGAKALTESQKVQARASLIARALADAQGDLAKTAGGVANSSRGLMGRIENLSASLGQAFLPITQQALGALNRFAGSIEGMATSAGPMIASFVDGAASAWDTFSAGAIGAGGAVMSMASGMGPAVETAMSLVEGLGFAWRNLPTIVEIAALQWGEKIANMVEGVKAFGTNIGIVGNWIADNWATLVIDGLSLVDSAIGNLIRNVGDAAKSIAAFLADPTSGISFNWTPLLEGFKATTAKLPELAKPAIVSYQQEIAAATARIAESELARDRRLAAGVAERSKLAASAIAAPSQATTPVAAATKTEAPKFAGAAALGSKEAAEAILRARYGSGPGGKGAEDRTAKNTGDAVTVLKQIRDGMARRAPAQAAGLALGAISGNF